MVVRMAWGKPTMQQAFIFHFVLAVIAMLVINVCDIYMITQHGLNKEDNLERINVPGSSIMLHPYHFWVMGVLWLTINLFIAVTYVFYTKDMLGAAILLAIGIIYSVLAVQDVLFFYYKGQELPAKWPWMYWQKEVFGTVPVFTIVIMALIGLIAIFGLFAFRLHTFKKSK